MAIQKFGSDSLSRDHYAYDLHKDTLSKGEVWDEDAIKQSIEMIIATMVGERIFNPFGCEAVVHLFKNFSPDRASTILTAISRAIAKWEPRAKLDEPNMRIFYDVSNPNSFILFIPFTIVPQNIVSRFTKKILL